MEGLGYSVHALGTDVAFALPRPDRPQEPVHDVLLNVSGLLWNTDNHGESERYQTLIRSLISRLLDEGRDVTFLPHDVPQAKESDLLPSEELSREFGGLSIVTPTSLEQVRQVTASARVAIGSRMHMCLNSLSTGTPAVPLGYSRKFTPLLSDVGWLHSIDLASNPTVETIMRELEVAEASDVERVIDRAHQRLVKVEELYRSFLKH